VLLALDEMQLNAGLAQQRQWGGSLGTTLIELGFVDEIAVYQALADQLGVTLVSIGNRTIPLEIVNTVPPELCAERMIFPFRFADRTLTIATTSPHAIDVQDHLAFKTGFRVALQLCPRREIEWAIRYYHHGDHSPCPPPKKRNTFDDGELRLVDAGGRTMSGGRTYEDIKREHEAQQRAQSAQQGFQAPPATQSTLNVDMSAVVQQLGYLKHEVQSLRQDLIALHTETQRQQQLSSMWLSLLIDKGVITQEEYRQAILSLQRGAAG
jgi:hypothetical protein